MPLERHIAAFGDQVEVLATMDVGQMWDRMLPGIALSMAYTPMRQNAQAMIPHLVEGVKKRIDLINAMSSKRDGKPIIAGYEVTIAFIEPVNQTEIWNSIGSLTGITSHATQLRHIPTVLDVDAELARIQDEEDAKQPSQEEVAARPEAIAAEAEKLRPVLNEIFENIAATTLTEAP